MDDRGRWTEVRRADVDEDEDTEPSTEQWLLVFGWSTTSASTDGLGLFGTDSACRPDADA
jgi:hypothetical protein